VARREARVTMIHYHPRGLDLRALAALCNTRTDDAGVALDRLLERERRRVAAKENTP